MFKIKSAKQFLLITLVSFFTKSTIQLVTHLPTSIFPTPLPVAILMIIYIITWKEIKCTNKRGWIIYELNLHFYFTWAGSLLKVSSITTKYKSSTNIIVKGRRKGHGSPWWRGGGQPRHVSTRWLGSARPRGDRRRAGGSRQWWPWGRTKVWVFVPMWRMKGGLRLAICRVCWILKSRLIPNL
jgi:hypothetical protein